MHGLGLRSRRLWSLLGLVALVAVSFGRSGDLGQPTQIESFTLPDASGQPWKLPDAKQAPLVVVVFTGTVCPINNAFMPVLAKMHGEYEGKGVAFVAINANVQDDTQAIAEHARQNKLPFPVLKDEKQVVADRFGAKHTPEAFLLDAERRIRYHGRISDQFGIGYKRAAPTRSDLTIAIDEVLAGQEVSVAITEVEGCEIARAAAPKADATVTFSKDVARILQQNCQECHRPGQVGPMPLVTYDDTAPWAGTIRRVVQTGRMPPWHADPHFGSFSNTRGLSDADKATLLEWIEQGCPPGDPADLPPAPEFAEGWRIGQPDTVFTMPQAYKVPATVGPRGVPYQYFFVPTNFEQDMWVQAAEAKPGARDVVHHIVVYVTQAGQLRQNAEDRVGDGFLVGYAPGDMPSVYAPGLAKKIPKGAFLLFQMHYTPNGTAREDRSSLGLIFAKEPPKYEVRTRGVMNTRFEIPPGEANYVVRSQSTFSRDALLVNLLPHMHLRGKSFKYEAVYPDGKRETLLWVPRYDFNWQSNYQLKEPLRLPAGTRLECTATFDNSKANKNNPDPTASVRWGDQTWEEMMVGFLDYIYVPDGK